MNYTTFSPANNWQVDNFPIISDIPASLKTDAQLYQTLKTTSNLTPDQQTQLANLTVELQSYIISTFDWNAHGQAIINVESLVLRIVNFQDMGSWSNSISYKMWNSVTLNGQTYISKQDNNTGNTPIGGSSDLWWSLAAQKGAKGDTGATGAQGLPGLNLVYMQTYNSSTSYAIGNAVSFSNSIYWCTNPTSGGIDPTNSGYWALFLSNTAIPISTSAPLSPSANQLWINSTTGIISYWNITTSTWVPLTASAITDGTHTYTPTDINNLSNEITVLSVSKGQVNGIATLDSTGNVPSSQLGNVPPSNLLTMPNAWIN